MTIWPISPNTMALLIQTQQYRDNYKAMIPPQNHSISKKSLIIFQLSYPKPIPEILIEVQDKLCKEPANLLAQLHFKT